MECPACGAKCADGARFCPSCGGDLAVPGPDPLIGQVVGGRFHVLSLVAEGGMGKVYAAEQRMGTTLRKVAIKTLLPDVAESEAQVQRFLLECSLVSELEHPNTIRFYDWGKTDAGVLFIAMEFVSGRSLAEIVRGQGGLPPERVDVIVGQIAGSLQEAHEKKIVHRDVKPDNVLLTNAAGEEDFVKVLDFGIAKRSDLSAPKLTPLGLVLGSPAYMSPEQFSPGELDPRSDVYSLGVVTYEALTGRTPFFTEELHEWPMLHRTATPPPFEELGVRVPENMRRAVMRALAKKPDERQGSMREYFAELTLGTPRRSSLTSGRPPSRDEAPTLVKRSAPPGSAASRPPITKGGTEILLKPSEPPPTEPADAPGGAAGSQPPGAAFKESSVAPPPLVVPPAPRLPSSVGEEAASAGAAADPVPPTVRDPAPATERDPKSPRRRWPLMLAGVLLAVVLGGAVAALVLPQFAPPRAPERPTAPHRARP
ncbi:MAG TPA: protein kinase, partial [Minicystis sp.]|nr:protein kinase [Minicystis sp.]